MQFGGVLSTSQAANNFIGTGLFIFDVNFSNFGNLSVILILFFCQNKKKGRHEKKNDSIKTLSYPITNKTLILKNHWLTKLPCFK